MWPQIIFAVVTMIVSVAVSLMMIKNQKTRTVAGEVEAPSVEKEIVNELVLNIMCHATELKVPLEVNSAWGHTWSEAK